MAAKKLSPKKADENEIVIDDAYSVEDEKMEEDVRVNESVNVTQEQINSTDKMVKVATSRDHKCTVGGETYYFAKGKQVSVPFNVKTILKNAGVLAAF